MHSVMKFSRLFIGPDDDEFQYLLRARAPVTEPLNAVEWYIMKGVAASGISDVRPVGVQRDECAKGDFLLLLLSTTSLHVSRLRAAWRGKWR